MDRIVEVSSTSPPPSLQTRKLIASIAALFALACLIALGALFNIAASLNADEREKSSFYAHKALEQRLEAARQFLSSYAV
ncbi:MAG: hypothetical protein ACRERW_19060, partial [Pseudomonas sp.]